MALNDPTITAYCDRCNHESDPMELCSLAGGGWDERYIPSKLKRMGWEVNGKQTICSECTEEEE